MYLSIRSFFETYCGSVAHIPPPQSHLLLPRTSRGIPRPNGIFHPSGVLWVCPGSPPSWTCPEDIQRGVPGATSSDGWSTSTGSIRHKATLALSSFCMSELFLRVIHPARGACFSHLYPRFHHLTCYGHRWELRCRNVDRWRVNWECHLQTQLPLHYHRSIMPASLGISHQSDLPWISSFMLPSLVNKTPRYLNSQSNGSNPPFYSGYHGHSAVKRAEVYHQHLVVLSLKAVVDFPGENYYNKRMFTH